MQTSLLACLCLASSARAAGVGGSLSRPFLPMSRADISRKHVMLPAICTGTLRRHFVPAICAEANSAKQAWQPVDFFYPPNSQDWLVKRYKSEWEDQAKFWAAAATATTQTGFAATLAKIQLNGIADRASLIVSKLEAAEPLAKEAAPAIPEPIATPAPAPAPKRAAGFASGLKTKETKPKSKATEVAAPQAPTSAVSPALLAWGKALRALEKVEDNVYKAGTAKAVFQAADATSQLALKAGLEELSNAWSEAATNWNLASQSLDMSVQMAPNFPSTPAVALISLFVGSGLTLIAIRSRRSASSLHKEPFLATTQ